MVAYQVTVYTEDGRVRAHPGRGARNPIRISCLKGIRGSKGYLSAHGYDVWLLDYRASPALPAATPFTLDDERRSGVELC